jgi:hypothetical protein
MPPQKTAERPSSELRSAGYAHRCHLYRAPTLAGAAVHPQASDDWIESEVGLSWRRAPGLYPKRHGWGRGVVMAELDIRFQRIWSQTRVPVILHQGTGEPLLVRVPYAQDNRSWIRGECRNQPTWDAARKRWETPRAWFNRLIDQALERYGQVYVVQLYKELQKCAPACWNAQGHDCECSCMGTNHGSGHPGGRWHEVSETFAFQWGPTQYACRHLVRQPATGRTGSL